MCALVCVRVLFFNSIFAGFVGLSGFLKVALLVGLWLSGTGKCLYAKSELPTSSVQAE